MKGDIAGRPGSAAARQDRPDILTDADTIVLPSAGGTVGVAPAPARPRYLPLPRPQARRVPPDEGYTPTRRRTVISRLALLGILALQAALTLRLRNTAFEDEALYLYAGRMEIAHLLHGAALQGFYASYFSGAPTLYPVLDAALNEVGGLALARALSLVEMLAVTAMLYSIARFCFNERVALCSAALFAVSEPALFVGHLATYDATSLFLLAASTAIGVRASASRWWLAFVLLAAPLAALAVAVKYAGALFVPTVATTPALAGWPRRGRSMLLYPPVFCIIVALLLAAGLRVGGHAYVEAIMGTTTNRAQGTTPDGVILQESAEWGGVVTALAAIGMAAYTWRARTERGELVAPSGGPLRRALLGAVMFGTVFLAPVYQMHLHTDVSLQKHIGFGMFFAAPIAGVGLARVMGDHFRRPQLGIAVWSLALALGIGQSWTLYHAWPASGPFVSVLERYLAPGAKYLVEVPEVPIYYLEGRADAQPDQFSSTYNITYIDSRGQTLTGDAGFTAAVRAGAFRIIAYSDSVTPSADAVIARAVVSSHRYRLVKVVPLSDAYGRVSYYVWVKTSRRPVRISAAGTYTHPRT